MKANKKNYTLVLTNSPKAIKKGRKPLTRYTKELIKVGKYIKASAGLAFEVTQDTLKHWVDTFDSWIENGLKVPIPLGHDAADDPEKNQGWVKEMFIKNDTLFGVLELTDPKLALTTDVSIYVPADFTDGHGNKYSQPITHVALCTNPVIPGLGNFEQLSLSLSGDKEMDTEKQEKIDADKADVKAAADKAAIAKAVAKELSQKVEPTSDVLVKLVVENRENKLNYLVTAGIITPATKTAIYEKLIKPEVLSLILAQGSDDGYDFLIQILTENKTVSLQEKSRQQLLELANVRSQGEENPVSVDIDKRIEKAKQK